MPEPTPHKSSPEPDESPTLLPNDHITMIVELLRPMGPQLARRWLAALLLVPEHEREALVEAIEEQIVREYTDQ